MRKQIAFGILVMFILLPIFAATWVLEKGDWIVPVLAILIGSFFFTWYICNEEEMKPKKVKKK